MPEHYVALLSWDVREHWPEVAPKGLSGRPKHPYAYGSCHPYFLDVAKKRPVLWIVASPNYGKGSRRLPPTIIARLQICGYRRGKHPLNKRCAGSRLIHPNNFKWVAIADRQDRKSNKYLRVNNAFHELTTIRFVDSRSKSRVIPHAARRRANPYSHVPTYLQNVRRVRSGDEQLLEDLARRVTERRTVFLSYKHEDCDLYVQELATELRKQDFAPWIDIESIPEIREEDGDYDDPALEQMMKDGIRQAGLVVVVRSRNYGRSRWTRFEWKVAKNPPWTARTIPVVQVVRGRSRVERGIHNVQRKSPAETARLIGTWWDAQAGPRAAARRRASF